MSSLQIYIDSNFPNKLVNALIDIHSLQKQLRFKIIDGKKVESFPTLSTNVVLLFVNYRKNVEIPIIKHYNDGYKVVVYKVDNIEEPDFFEFSMTALRVWPRIIDVSLNEVEPFIYTFNYGGKSIRKKKM